MEVSIKKCGLFFIMSVLLCILLTSCGVPNPPKEAEIIRELPSDMTTVIIENPFDMTNADVYQLDVASLSIEKRQTNDKEDIVYCVVELENQYYQFTKYVILYYNYYDQGGWILDNWEYYNDTVYSVLCDPFGEDCAALKWSYEYDTVDLTGSSFDTDNNSITYTLQVNTQYKYASVDGTLTDTYTFDGKRWIETTDTSGISMQWNITGHWESFENGDSSFLTGAAMDVSRFDQAVVSGTVTFYYSDFSPLNFQLSQQAVSRDLADAKITSTADTLTLEWSVDCVRIGLDDASCEYYDGWGTRRTVQNLQLVSSSSSEAVVDTEEVSEEDIQEFSGLISQYFQFLKNLPADEGNWRVILSAEFPNLMGDDVFYALQYILEENAVSNFTHEIVAADEYDMAQPDAKRMWEIAQEEEFYEGPLSELDAYAEVIAKTTFVGKDGSDDLIYYNAFLMVKIDGTWNIYYADDLCDEPPEMFFPF